MIKPKVKIFTPYNNYTDCDITKYIETCYSNYNLSFEFTTRDDFDYAIVINYTKSEDFFNIYRECNKRNVLYFQYEPSNILISKQIKNF